MKLRPLALSFLFLAGSATTTYPQQILTMADVTKVCPDIRLAEACPEIVQEYMDGRAPGSRRDEQIVGLVVKLAELGNTPRVRMPVCLNTADGIRLLATGVTNNRQQAAIEEIADSMCLGVTTATVGVTESLAG